MSTFRKKLQCRWVRSKISHVTLTPKGRSWIVVTWFWQNYDVMRLLEYNANQATFCRTLTSLYFLGPRGVRGADGQRGPDGASGARYAGGPMVEGQRGVPGGRGRVGVVGEIGTQGPAGSPGDRGVRGSAGAPGFPGRPGSPGQRGATGAEGRRGATVKLKQRTFQCKDRLIRRTTIGIHTIKISRSWDDVFIPTPQQQMMTSSDGNDFHVTAGPLWGESTGNGGFPS